MNHYPHHIGDYLKDTAHLTMIEDGAYRRLLDLYYQHEQPLPADKRQVYRLARATTPAERKAVDTILSEYFTATPDGHRHSRCDEEIEQYQAVNEDSEARKENEKERQRRHRQRRKELFEALRAHDVVPAWDTKTSELETLLSQYRKRPVTRDSNAPVTRTATANQYPIPITHIKTEETTTTPPPESREADAPPSSSSLPEKIPDEAPARAVQLAVILRRGGACPNTHATSRGMAELVGLNTTDAEALAALETAKRQRQASGSAQAITVAYLVPIVRELRATPPDKPAPKPRDDWYRSDVGIERKGREIGLHARAGESYSAYADRIRQALTQQAQGAQP